MDASMPDQPISRLWTANSALFVSWDIGAGLGTLLGDVLSEAFGFGLAFWGAALVNLADAGLFLMHGCYTYRRAMH